MNDAFKRGLRDLADHVLNGYTQGRALYEANIAILVARGSPLAKECPAWGALTERQQDFWHATAENAGRENND
jgi:hypothetical protein